MGNILGIWPVWLQIFPFSAPWVYKMGIIIRSASPVSGIKSSMLGALKKPQCGSLLLWYLPGLGYPADYTFILRPYQRRPGDCV